MRFMIKVRIPMDRDNSVIKNGSLGPTLQSILGDLQPEAAYFTAVDDCRGMYVVVDIEDASQIPAVAEPHFLAFGATLEIDPLMTAEDLAYANPVIEQAAHNYG